MNTRLPHKPNWLEKAVLYQIYPSSFQDSNGDGIGDIPGIIHRLNYLKSLGVNTIWLCPCFKSAFRDGGYDITDFYTVDPRYGTNNDLRDLFDKAHACGLKVILDLVAGHTSIDHPWFQQSAKPERNKYTDYYLWTDSTWEHPQVGGCPMHGYSDRDGNFLTNFFWSQPSLNYGFADPNPDKPWQQPVDAPGPQAVRAELRSIMDHWLAMGADGFRVDMAASLIKSNDPEKRKPALEAFWQEINRWLTIHYPEAALISEWSCPAEAVASGFHVDFMIHFRSPAYTSLFRLEEEAFRTFKRAPSYFDAKGRGTLHTWLDEFVKQRIAIRHRGFISLPSGNHDLAPRLGERRSIEELKVIYTFLFTLPHIPTLYYGDEVGMRGARHLQSKEGAYNRVGARTPMLWDNTPNAGFSTASPDLFYLPVDHPENGRNVADCQNDPGSLLAHIRTLIQLREHHSALGTTGDFSALQTENNGYPFVYERRGESETCTIAINPTDSGLTANGYEGLRTILSTGGACPKDDLLILPPHSSLILTTNRKK